jgi:hypothetical protein
MKIIHLTAILFVLLLGCNEESEPKKETICQCSEMITSNFQDGQEIFSETTLFEYTDGRLSDILRRGNKDLVSYDAQGRISRIEDNYIPLVSRTFIYDQGKLIETKTDGSCVCSPLPTTYEYNSFGQLIRSTEKFEGGPEYPTIRYFTSDYNYQNTIDKQPLSMESSLGLTELTYDDKKRPFENIHPMILNIPGLPYIPSINNVVSITGASYDYSCNITYNDQGYPMTYDVQNNLTGSIVKNVFKYDCGN